MFVSQKDKEEKVFVSILMPCLIKNISYCHFCNDITLYFGDVNLASVFIYHEARVQKTLI